MAFDRSRYKSDGRLIFEDKIDENGNLQKTPSFQLPDYADGSDAYANNWDTILSFQNVRNPDGHNVSFKAFITAFNETYTPNFNATEVFGRTDPIQQYKNTTRNITLAWKLPAASESESYENLGKAQSLIQMLYPSYLDVNSALTLSQAPLVRLRVMNLLQKNKNEKVSAPERNNKQLYDEYFSVSDSGSGLLGVITSCTVNHNLEGTDGVFQKARGTILPKLIDINISFVPLHEQTLGYDADDSIDLFPYGVQLGKGVSSGRQDKQNPWQKDAFNGNRGQSLSELREVAKTLEEKRRKAASAQQTADRAAGAARRAQRRLDRRGDNMSEERRGRLETNVALEEAAQTDAANTAADVTQVESLIGSNSTY